MMSDEAGHIGRNFCPNQKRAGGYRSRRKISRYQGFEWRPNTGLVRFIDASISFVENRFVFAKERVMLFNFWGVMVAGVQ